MSSTKLYNNVARRIRQIQLEPNNEEDYTPIEVVKAIADAFEEDNPRFDRHHFLQECGL